MEEDNGLPSFIPAGEEALSPSGLAGGSPGAASAREPGCEEAPAQQLGGEGADGARAHGADADGSPPSPHAPGTSVSPHGAVSPPAATVFGGGLFDPVPSTGGNSNISHSVPLDTDSDSGLEVDELTAAGTNDATDAEAPGAGLPLHGPSGARR